MIVVALLAEKQFCLELTELFSVLIVTVFFDLFHCVASQIVPETQDGEPPIGSYVVDVGPVCSASLLLMSTLISCW